MKRSLLFAALLGATIPCDGLAQALPTPKDTWYLASGDFSQPDPRQRILVPDPQFGWLTPADAELAGDLEKWRAQAQAGRAQAAALAAAVLMESKDRALRSCGESLKMIGRAEELGSARAAWLRGKFYAGDCGKQERAKAFEPLRIAAERNNAAAARLLGDLYARGPKELRDPALAHLYREFADYREDPASVSRATDPLKSLIEKADAHDLRLLDSFDARDSIIVTSGDYPPGWSYVARRVDHTGECFENLTGNCRGVPRSIRVEIHNTHTTHLQCQVAVRARTFVGTDAVYKQRIAWVAPGANRDLQLAVAPGEVLPEDIKVACAPIDIDAATGRPVTCQARIAGELRADDFYPPALKRAGIGGTVTVRILALTPGKPPADVEVAKSAGNAVLDQAAMDAVRSRDFMTKCKYGLSMLKLVFHGE